jgi:hypothetical protein
VRGCFRPLGEDLDVFIDGTTWETRNWFCGVLARIDPECSTAIHAVSDGTANGLFYGLTPVYA